MDAIHIRGGNALFGETKIQGSKNAVLPIMAAALLIEDVTVIENCPRISDVNLMQKILTGMGCKITRSDRTLSIDAGQIHLDAVEGEAARGMRSSIMLLGAMLARCGEASLEYPGGCVIGKRPVDLHLDALRRLGVAIQEQENGFIARAEHMTGCPITLPTPSVGATENIILAALGAKGVTILQNAAREPEITALCSFLINAGAEIEGTGSSRLLIRGGKRLHGSRFFIPADRIVAGTYLMSVLGCGGHVFLRNAPAAHMKSVIRLGGELGAEITVTADGISVIAKPVRKAVPYIRTDVYPGFPTDLQSPLMAVLTRAEGRTVLEETIFEDRFHIAEDLQRMGAKIQIEGNRAVIYGIDRLKGCRVLARELRGGAGLVLAGCMAEGETIVCNRHFIERGYEDICRDLQNLGINIVTG